MTRLQEHYREVVVPKLQEEFSYKNPHAGAAAREDRHQHGGRRRRCGREEARPTRTAELTKLSGQKPAVCRARKSVANFKLREGMPIGCKVTLRRRAHVRVPRPAGQHRPAAGARLPRRVAEELRRPRQLRARASRSRSSSRRSASTTSTRRGAWTSSSARRRRTDEEAKALLAGFNMPFTEVTGRGLATWRRRAPSRRTTAVAGWWSSSPPSVRR